MTSSTVSNDQRGSTATPQRLRATLRTWLWLIVVGTVVGAVVGFAVASVTPPKFSASVTMWVTPTEKAEGIGKADLDVVQALMPTLAELATKTPIMEEVIDSTGIDIDKEVLADSVTTDVPADTSLLTITVKLPNPDDAARLANAIAEELSDFVPAGATTSAELVDMTVVDAAVAPTIPDGPGILLRTALGAAVGLFMTMSFVFLLENVWPQNRWGWPFESVGTAEESADEDPSAVGPIWPSDTRRTSTIGTNPWDSDSSASKALTASRGLVNELEMERTKAIE